LPLRPRTLVTAGLCCLLAALALAALVPAVFGRPLSKVDVTWRGIEPGARQALEARFKLSEPQRVDDATWSYVPLDRSSETYRAIVTNGAVEDTEGINRRTFAEAEGPPLTERRGGLWHGAPRGVARVVLAGSFALGLFGVIALVIGAAVDRRHLLRSGVGNMRARWPGAGAAAAWLLASPVIVVLLVAAAAAFRFLSLDYFENDHFTYVAYGYQSALGELPVRDYDDPGFPLGIALSALAMRIGGTTLLPEAVLTIAALAAAAGFAWRASLSVSRMPALALFAAALQIVAYPRLYSYPKILAGAAAPLAFLAYARRPTLLSLFWLSCVTELSLLLRHDLAAYVGVAACVFLLAQHDDLRLGIRRVGLYVVMCALLTIPYALYLMAFGVEAHFASAVGFSQAEARRTGQWGSLFTSGSPFAFALLLLPIGVLTVLAWRRVRAGRWDAHAPAVAGSSVLLLLIDVGMMRDTTPARLSDVVGPAPAVFAWAAAAAIGWRNQLSSAGTKVIATLALALAAATAAAGVAQQGLFVHRLYEGRIPDGWSAMRNHAGSQFEVLQAWPWIDLTQSGGLDGVVRYVDRCTTPEQSVLVVGYMPQLPFLVQRRFAGGHSWIMRGYFESDSDQARMARRLTEDPPAVVVIEPQEADDIAGHWPAIAARLKSYSEPHRVDGYDVRTDPGGVRGTDAQTGLACFR
jgi:hypothetical protein